MLEGVYQSFGYPPNGPPHLPPPPPPQAQPPSAYSDNPVEPQVQPYVGYRDPYSAYRGTNSSSSSSSHHPGTNGNNNNNNNNSGGGYYAYHSPTSSSSSANYEAPSPIFPDHRSTAVHPNSDPNNYYASSSAASTAHSPTASPPPPTSATTNGWQVRPPPPPPTTTTAPTGYPWSISSPPARPHPSAGGGFIGARTGGDLDMSNQARHHHHHHHHHPISPPGFGPPASLARPKLTTTVWEDEGTVCYQVDAKGICVARRADKEMINGTKLLNVVGMSRGKRDGILKNEKDRVVIKVGAMHLKGVWITLRRAKYLATKFRICDLLYPLFEDDPKKYVYATSPPGHPASAAAAAAAAAAIAAGVSSPPASVASSRRASSLLDNSPDSLSSGIRSSSFNDNTKRSSLPSMSALDQVTSRLSPPHQLSASADPSSLGDTDQQSSSSPTLPEPNSTATATPSSHNTNNGSYNGLNYYYHHQYDYSRSPAPTSSSAPSLYRFFPDESSAAKGTKDDRRIPQCAERGIPDKSSDITA